MLIGAYFRRLQILKDEWSLLLDGLRELLEELNVVVVLLLVLRFVVGLLVDVKQAVLLRREIYLKLKQSVHNFVDILVYTDQVVLDEVSLTKLNPLFSLLFLSLHLVDVVNIMVLFLTLFGLAHGQL